MLHDIIPFCFTLKLSDRQRLKINVVLAPNHSVSAYRPETPPDTLSRYGFEGMILQFIEAPDPQLAVYCHFHNLHNVPLANDLSPQQLERVGSNWRLSASMCICVRTFSRKLVGGCD